MRSCLLAVTFGVVLADTAGSALRAADQSLPPAAPRDSRKEKAVPPEETGPLPEAARMPAPPPVREEVALPQRGPGCCERWNPFYYLRHSRNQAAAGRHHEKGWCYRDGAHHGFPYGCSPYEPRAVGASYTLPEWTPRRSYYYAYQPGYQDLPYGFSPEPYYGPLP